MRHLQRIRRAARRAASIAARRHRPSAVELWAAGPFTRPTSNVSNGLVDRGAGRRLGLVDSDSGVRRAAREDVDRRLLKCRVAWVRRIARDRSLDGVDLDLDRLRDKPTFVLILIFRLTVTAVGVPKV
jgi:hypothetical protein